MDSQTFCCGLQTPASSSSGLLRLLDTTQPRRRGRSCSFLGCARTTLRLATNDVNHPGSGRNKNWLKTSRQTLSCRLPPFYPNKRNPPRQRRMPLHHAKNRQQSQASKKEPPSFEKRALSRPIAVRSVRVRSAEIRLSTQSVRGLFARDYFTQRAVVVPPPERAQKIRLPKVRTV